MVPVKQKIQDYMTGDCLAACIASLLEMKQDNVPNFVALFPVNHVKFGWFELLYYWLWHFDYDLKGHFTPDKLSEYEGIGGYIIVSVESNVDSSTHACIYSVKDKRIVHDPEPGDPAIKANAPILGFYWIEKANRG